MAQRTLRLGVALTVLGALALGLVGADDAALIPLALGLALMALGARVARPGSLRARAAVAVAGAGFFVALPGAAQLVQLLGGGAVDAAAPSVVLRAGMAALCAAYVVAAAWFPGTQDPPAV